MERLSSYQTVRFYIPLYSTLVELYAVQVSQYVSTCVHYLGTSTELRSATIIFVMSVCLFVRPRGTTRLPLKGF